MISYLQENFTRRILHRLGVRKDSSSYPFLSGNTFRDLCDYVIPADFDSFFSSRHGESAATTTSFFLHASLGSSFTLYMKDRPNLDLSNSDLVLHNYDNIPNEVEFEYLASRFKRIHSVNWLGSRKIANPIPIGLENWSYWRNGVPSDFRKHDANKIPAWNARPIELLCAFSVSTNFAERKIALEEAQHFGKSHIVSKPLVPSKYRKLLLSSKFVLSPPGNGADCHRTWEAIYLGAVPVVLSKFWAFGHLNLPVLILDDWGALKSEIELYDKNEQLSVDKIAKLFLEKPFDYSS